MESRKMVVMNLFAGQQQRNRHRDRLMDTGRGEERVRGMERVKRKLTLSYVKQIANGNLLYVAGMKGLYLLPRGRGKDCG